MASSYTCDECRTVFPRGNLLQQHVKDTKHAAYRCPHAGCGKTYIARQSWSTHKSSHEKTPHHICSKCFKAFHRKDRRDEHECKCHPQATSSKSPVKLSLDRHMPNDSTNESVIGSSATPLISKAVESVFDQLPTATLTGDGNTIVDMKPHKCPVISCPKAYKDPRGLTYHRQHGHQNQVLKQNLDGTFTIIKSFEGGDCQTTNPLLTNPGLDLEVWVEVAPSSYKCTHCSKRYKLWTDFQVHHQQGSLCGTGFVLVNDDDDDDQQSRAAEHGSSSKTNPRALSPAPAHHDTEIEMRVDSGVTDTDMHGCSPVPTTQERNSLAGPHAHPESDADWWVTSQFRTVGRLIGQLAQSPVGSLMSWKAMSVGSFIRSDVDSAFATPASYNVFSSSQQAKVEAKHLKDYACCGAQFQSLHELVRHSEAAHAAHVAITIPSKPWSRTQANSLSCINPASMAGLSTSFAGFRDGIAVSNTGSRALSIKKL